MNKIIPSAKKNVFFFNFFYYVGYILFTQFIENVAIIVASPMP